MLNSLRASRASQPPSVFSYSLHHQRHKHPNRNTCAVRFTQSTSSPGDMEQKPEPKQRKAADTMSSFGEGYATRADEEGFGGIYGGNQSVCPESEEKNPPDFDHSQGSEVKEKEKARHQKQNRVDP